MFIPAQEEAGGREGLHKRLSELRLRRKQVLAKKRNRRSLKPRKSPGQRWGRGAGGAAESLEFSNTLKWPDCPGGAECVEDKSRKALVPLDLCTKTPQIPNSNGNGN